MCQGVLEAAAPQAAPPAPSPSGCCEETPRRAGGRDRSLHQTPRGARPSSPGAPRAPKPGAARTYRGGFAVHGPGSGLGWAQSSGTAMPAARCRAEPAPRGRGRRCLASGLVRQCREQTSRTCRPAPAPPVSQLLQAQPAKHLPCAGRPRDAGQGQRGLGNPGAGETWPQGTAASRGSPLLSWLPKPPFLPSVPTTHSPTALLPCQAQRRGCTALPNPRKTFQV